MRNHLLTTILATACSLTVTSAEYEDNHILQINRLPARAFFMPYGKTPGDRTMSLNGKWKFHWSPTPDNAVSDFQSPAFDDNGWADLTVPSVWEVNGYGTPIYASAGYTFRIAPPFVMQEPKSTYTTYTERNPTGQYRRRFTLPESWSPTNGRHTILRFDGAMSCLSIWVNGSYVGYTQGNSEPAEYDITPYLLNGENTIALQVLKYSDGAYLEDQDAWRFGGLHRDVTLYQTTPLRLRDFTVRTIAADSTCTAFHLQINPKLQAHPQAATPQATVAQATIPQAATVPSDSSEGNSYTIEATLTDAEGKEVATLSTPAAPVLNPDHKAAVMNEWYPQRGRMKFERMDTILTNIHTWTAETPYLYTLTIALRNTRTGEIAEQAQQHVGFRQLDMRNGQLLINGRPIRLRGVNRGEHDGVTARTMTEERMVQDIMLMKAANINAVRTSHYPSHPRWYDLCDSLGLYVMDEAGCENHGVRGELTSTPDWNDAMMDRVIRMAERDKNHPSVILWSLGNESGFGANHAAMAGWLHEFDPTRFVHYEGAQGPDGNDPSCVDIISRFYPRVQQEYLNPGVKEGTGEERAENARWEHLLALAKGSNGTRPVLTSEYAHCMGNALGNFQEYWDEIYSHPRMLGGFIWDWADQGIMTAEGIKYGGDFGDKPNLKAFCLNGVVKCDRQLTAKYHEVQHVYSPVQFARHGSDLFIINRNHHTSLSDYAITACYQYNGKEDKSFTLAIPDVQPGDSAVIAVRPHNKKPHTDIRLNLTVTRSGTMVTKEQFPISGTLLDFLPISHKPSSHKPSSHKASQPPFPEIHLRTLPHPMKLSFYRAPLDNDKGFGNWLAKDWTTNKVDSPEVVRLSDTTEEYRFVKGKVTVTTVATTLPDGATDIMQTYECSGDVPDLPRLALQIDLPSDFEQLEYYGRGPWDCYPDRWRSCHVGLWKSTVTDEYAHYPLPQDCGNHIDCAYVALRNKAGKTFTVTATDAPFTFSALHYTPQEIAASAHDNELPSADRHTILTIACATLGIGNSSCGPGVLKKYSIDKHTKHTLHIIVRE